MKIFVRLGVIGAILTVGWLLLEADSASAGRGRGGGRGGGGRGGGGGGFSRPSGGGGFSPSINPSINRSPGVGGPGVSQPSFGPGGGGGAHSRPGVVTSPKLSPGTRPGIDVGQRPAIGTGPKVGTGPGVGKPGIGSKPGVGTVGTRPGGPSNLLPGLGVGVGAGIAAGKAGDVLGRRQEGVQDRKANVADRSQNLKDRMEHRQDFKEQAQDKRQDYLENRREDWQNWHDDYHGHHNGWYHGHWCEHAGDRWQHMWSEHTAAMVIGTTMWGLNRMSYWFGTGDYSNPYYSEPLVVDDTTIYYSEPLAAPPVSAEPAKEPSELPPGVTQEGLKQFEAARTSFYEGKYQAALAATNKALASMPKDAVLHEFRALVLFALGKYADAATTLHPVLAVGPGWDWTTMRSLYPDLETYTKQMRDLETYVEQKPKAADGHFVLAYHYLTLGHQTEAARELQDVHKLLPKDTVSAQLLQMMGKAPPPPTATESAIKIDSAKLIGTWHAARKGKATFELTLTKDQAFTWVYREGKKHEEVKGAYALDGNVLALEPDAGGVMLAEITDPQAGSFVFRTVGAPKNDPGLTFKGK